MAVIDAAFAFRLKDSTFFDTINVNVGLFKAYDFS